MRKNLKDMTKTFPMIEQSKQIGKIPSQVQVTLRIGIFKASEANNHIFGHIYIEVKNSLGFWLICNSLLSSLQKFTIIS